VRCPECRAEHVAHGPLLVAEGRLPQFPRNIVRTHIIIRMHALSLCSFVYGVVVNFFFFFMFACLPFIPPLYHTCTKIN
jgi:hypothetical protein